MGSERQVASTKIVMGNWKMNGSAAKVATVLTALPSFPPNSDITICLPFPYLAQGVQLLDDKHCVVGAQNLSEFADGAYTGDVSASMLADIGCKTVLIGHSERRTFFAESDEVVAAKLTRAKHARLRCVVCVGETLIERDSGLAQQRIQQQLNAVLKQLDSDAQALAFCVAYEPVWAIGSGRAATEAQIAEMHQFIKNIIGTKFPVLYGGSVTDDNAANIMGIANVDGVLVGGASLDASKFAAICNEGLGK
jgi:triosephosphate isomerase (TIM)